MFLITRKRSALAVALVATMPIGEVASADYADADVISLSYVSYTPSRVVSASLNGTTKQLYAGFVNLYDNTNNTPLRGFCVQILESIKTGSPVDYTVATDIETVPDSPPSPMGAARAALVEDLYQRHFVDVSSATGETARDKAAAFGMVLWEIIHESAADGQTTASGVLSMLNLSANSFQASGGSVVDTLANSMLTSLGGSNNNSFLQFTSGDLFGVTNTTYQDFLIVVPGPTGLAALVGIAGLRRRRRS